MKATTKLKLMREAQGVRQVDLARRVGIGASTLCNIEQGDARTLAGTARKIARQLGLAPEDLFVQQGDKSRAIEA